MKRAESMDDLITTVEAAMILNRNNQRSDIQPSYLNNLVRYGKLQPHKLDGRTNLYRRGDVEAIVVERRGGKHIQDRRRKPSK